MLISFLVNQVNGGWSPTSKRLGGTEESVVEWAKRLATQGHRVEVYHNSPDGHYEEIDNVIYMDRSRYIGGGDVCVNVKCSDVAPLEPTIYFTNETNAGSLDLRPYSCVVWPSQYCVDNIPVNNPNVYVVPHGYDPDEIYPARKVPKQCFYASSPDRGLATLLEVWPRVYAEHPDATLLITYGVTGVTLPGVICLGECDNELMAEVYRTSDVWCHPCNGGELFCITGIKAQVAQCVPVIIPTMALRETVKHGVFCNDSDYGTVLSNALHESAEREKIRTLLSLEHYVDWDESTAKLLEVIYSALRLPS